MVLYKLHYFNKRGHAETARMILVAADQKFEDDRIDLADWPNQKKNFKFGQLPVLEVNGEQLNQSVAIIHFLGCLYGLAGKTPIDAAKCHATVETIRDMTNPVVCKLFNEKDEQKKLEIIKESLPDLKKFLTSFEDCAKANADKSGYLLAGQLTYADFEFHNAVTTIQNLLGADSIKPYPHIVKHHELINVLPRIREYLEKRPKTAL